MTDKKTIQLKVRDTQNIIFEGEVDRISSFNEVGPFDIYPMHANFISIIKKELALYLNKEKIKNIEFEQAVLKVKNDMAKIFLGIDVVSNVESFNQKMTETSKK